MKAIQDQIKLVNYKDRQQLLDLLEKIVFLFREGATESKTAATYTKEWHFKTLDVKVSYK